MGALTRGASFAVVDATPFGVGPAAVAYVVASARFAGWLAVAIAVVAGVAPFALVALKSYYHYRSTGRPFWGVRNAVDVLLLS